ncbi:putative fatty acyl-CoA reductase, partial [Fragariocoptes setiger]
LYKVGSRKKTEAMQSPIINFYNGRSIFITGGTGFMGKVLIEKLLRTCTGIKHIYVLMRAKRAHQPADRLNELVKSRLFDIVRNKQPNFIDKLVIVEGDVTLPQMGLSPGDIATLCREVSVVFHSAATVRFDDPLKQSIAINVIGTKNVIELCRRMRSVAAIVHVSTAYANCDKPIIEERFYPTDESPQQLMQLTEWMSESMLQALKPELLRARPNTYTYTKAMAEAYLINEAYDLPVIICRPSIVVASWREPVRGWIDNFNGPTGVLLAVGKGLVRSMYCNKSCTADIIPVDVLGTWPALGQLFHCTSGSINPITWGQVQTFVVALLRIYPSIQVFRYPNGNFEASKRLDTFYRKTLHYLPAYIFDFVSRMCGRRPILVKVFEKFDKAADVLSPFTTNDWLFRNSKTTTLRNQMTPEDRECFNFDISKLHWQTFFADYVLGVRHYLLKEDQRTLTQARRNLSIVYYRNLALQILLTVSCAALVVTPIMSFF